MAEAVTNIRVDGVPGFFVVFMTTRFGSLAEVQREAPEQLAEHIRTSKQLHDEGRLLMAGAFLDRPDEPLRTMGVLRSYDDARRYGENDPFVRAGLIEEWDIRSWANIFQ
ncbi:MAG: hypothetical protein J2P23_05425 [Microlunatus sp.]|nr:hypothetical protein [Microlunatus sp.]